VDNLNVAVEPISEHSTTVFYSVDPVVFIGRRFKQSDIRFDFLSADLRNQPEPYKVGADLLSGKISNETGDSFNIFKKLY